MTVRKSCKSRNYKLIYSVKTVPRILVIVALFKAYSYTKMTFLKCYLVLSLISFCSSFPAKRETPIVPSVATFNFMKKFGYIEEDDGNSEALFTENGLEEIIRNIQKFGAIPQTGKLDNTTLELMTKPRCGVPDIIRNKRPKRFILGPSAWKKRNITFFIANWPSTLTEREVVKDIILALDTWGRYGRLQFSRVYDPSADIIVAFGSGYHGDRYPFDGPGNILAHAYFPYEMESLGGDIHFDNDEKWISGQKEEEGVDFYSVAIHELGHSLGLSHSHVHTSVMFPYYTGATPGQSLDYDDVLGMYELYIKRRLQDDDKYPVSNPTTEFNTYNSEDDHYTSESTTTERKVRDRTTNVPSTTLTYPTTTRTRLRTTTEQKVRDGTSTTITYPTITRTRSRTTTDRSSEATISYHGDSETVDDHKEHDPMHGIPPTSSPSLPDICEGNYDAVASFRNEIFIFKEQYLWRLRKEYELLPGYPIRIHQMFTTLPKDIKGVDGAYERPDGMIILFTGRNYWVYDGSRFVENSPRPITDLGLPNYLEKIDAVQNWGKNGKTYFYKNNQFWRYNETSRIMDPRYPKHMERWRGVPTTLDAATTWKGVTYFFKGKCYWKFDNDWVIVTDTSPLPTPQTWLGCPKEDVEYCVSNNKFLSEMYPWYQKALYKI